MNTEFSAWQRDVLESNLPIRIAVTGAAAGQTVLAHEWLRRMEAEARQCLVVLPDPVQAAHFRREHWRPHSRKEIIVLTAEEVIRGAPELCSRKIDALLLFEPFSWQPHQIVLSKHQRKCYLHSSLDIVRPRPRWQRMWRWVDEVTIIDKAVAEWEWDQQFWAHLHPYLLDAKAAGDFRMLAVGVPYRNEPESYLQRLIQKAGDDPQIGFWHVPLIGEWSRTTSEGKVSFPPIFDPSSIKGLTP